jgi:ABC-type Na+ transport system ATPase subunit NatA
MLFIHSGSLIEEGSAREILDKYGHETLEEVFITIARDKGQ